MNLSDITEELDSSLVSKWFTFGKSKICLTYCKNAAPEFNYLYDKIDISSKDMIKLIAKCIVDWTGFKDVNGNEFVFNKQNVLIALRDLNFLRLVCDICLNKSKFVGDHHGG